jgi:hypothetical protein
MAITKTHTFLSGITACYWKVVRVDVDIFKKRVQLQVALYVSKEARDNNLRPVAIRPFEIKNQNDFDTYFNIDCLSTQDNNPYSQAYVYLKSLEEFKDCVDI